MIWKVSLLQKNKLEAQYYGLGIKDFGKESVTPTERIPEFLDIIFVCFYWFLYRKPKDAAQPEFEQND